jgi:elongator complex protein 6
VLSLAHEAEAILSLRLLDTGAAKDVSGVVRITRGGGALERAIEEHEYLYHVGGDGGVKVFERGH